MRPQHLFRVSAVIALSALLSVQSQAAIITQFTFGTSGTMDNTAAYSEVPTVVLPGVTASNFSDNGGATATYDNNASAGRVTAPQTNIKPNGGGAETLVGLEANHDNGRYVYFDVTIDASQQLSLTNLTFDYSRGGTSGTRYMGFATGLDADAIFVDAAAGATRSNYTNVDVDLSGALYQNLSGIVRFQFFSTGTSMDLDNITLNGTLTAIPEPSTMALAVLGLIGLGGVIRRRQLA